MIKITFGDILILAMIALAIFEFMPHDVKMGIGGAFMPEKKRKITRREILDDLYRDYGAQPFTSDEAERRRDVITAERQADEENYHKNIYDSMFWGGASQSELDNYYKNHLDGK